MAQLSDHHRRHIAEQLEQDRDLPPDYKHLLFPPERQEHELVCVGKDREEEIWPRSGPCHCSRSRPWATMGRIGGTT